MKQTDLICSNARKGLEYLQMQAGLKKDEHVPQAKSHEHPC